jgi:hypothetical protein
LVVKHNPLGGSPVSCDYTCPQGCSGYWEVTGDFFPGYPRSRYEPKEEATVAWDGQPPRKDYDHVEGCELTIEQEAEMIKHFQNDFVHEYLDQLPFDYDPALEEDWDE